MSAELLLRAYQAKHEATDTFNLAVAETIFNKQFVLAWDAVKKDAKKAGYTHLFVGDYHESRFLIGNTHIFAVPRTRNNSSWPAIWDIVRQHLGMSCGNGLPTADQAQSKIPFPPFLFGEHKL